MQRILIFILYIVSVLGGMPSYALDAKRQTLRVYTYNSFVTEGGSGATAKKKFEEECHCRVEFITFEDGGSLFSRLLLKGDATDADVVLGLDAAVLYDAHASGLFMPHGVDVQNVVLPIDWDDAVFLPVSYGYYSFIYDRTRLKQPPTSFEELVASKDISLIIQDPRSSSIGLGGVLWVKHLYGDRAAEVWHSLYPRIVALTKTWDQGYGLFLEGGADMIMSYTTGAVCHFMKTGANTYQAALFKEGHYMQIETAAILRRTKVPDLAKLFLQFLLSQQLQSAIAYENCLYPVVRLNQGLPKIYQELPRPYPIYAHQGDMIERDYKKWAIEWMLAMQN